MKASEAVTVVDPVAQLVELKERLPRLAAAAAGGDQGPYQEAKRRLADLEAAIADEALAAQGREEEARARREADAQACTERLTKRLADQRAELPARADAFEVALDAFVGEIKSLLAHGKAMYITTAELGQPHYRHILNSQLGAYLCWRLSALGLTVWAPVNVPHFYRAPLRDQLTGAVPARGSGGTETHPEAAADGRHHVWTVPPNDPGPQPQPAKVAAEARERAAQGAR